MIIQPRELKRLDLQFWQKMVWDGFFGRPCPLEDIAQDLKKVDVVVGKPGWYLWRGIETLSWFENGKEAYTTPRLVEDFKYEIEMLSHVPLTQRARTAIWHLIQENLADMKLRHLLGTDTQWWHLRSLERGFELYVDRQTQAFKLSSRRGFGVRLKTRTETNKEQ